MPLLNVPPSSLRRFVIAESSRVVFEGDTAAIARDMIRKADKRLRATLDAGIVDKR